MTAPLPLGEPFAAALALALELHADHARKGTAVPYVAHLLAVSALVLEDGGSEAEAIAALLHDAVEDCGGLPTLERIRTAFGEEVASIVRGCSDTDEIPKPPWHARKEAYIAHLAEASPGVVRVSLADKLHNMRAVRRDHGLLGDALWGRFSAGAEQQLWYYRSLAEAFRARSTSPMVGELEREIDALEQAMATV